jgi:hypothetical protein
MARREGGRWGLVVKRATANDLVSGQRFSFTQDVAEVFECVGNALMSEHGERSLSYIELDKPTPRFNRRVASGSPVYVLESEPSE